MGLLRHPPCSQAADLRSISISRKIKSRSSSALDATCDVSRISAPPRGPDLRCRGASRPFWNFWRSRSRQNCGACVTIDSMIKSASRPYLHGAERTPPRAKGRVNASAREGELRKGRAGGWREADGGGAAPSDTAHMQWCVSSSKSPACRPRRMKSMILCSPSPTTSAPEKTTVSPRHHSASSAMERSTQVL